MYHVCVYERALCACIRVCVWGGGGGGGGGVVRACVLGIFRADSL